jgi:hypothetical protein
MTVQGKTMTFFGINDKVRNKVTGAWGLIIDIEDDLILCKNGMNKDKATQYFLNRPEDLEHIGEPLKPWVVDVKVDVKVSGLADLERVNELAKEIQQRVGQISQYVIPAGTKAW